MRYSKIIPALFFLIPVLGLANKIDKVEITPESPDVNTELNLKLNFSVPEDKVSCGVVIDWGDGEKQRLRVGNGQQLTPPFKISHAYKNANQLKISVKGEFIARGLNSIGGCDVNVTSVITIQDPAVRAEKEKLENERRAEKERIENQLRAEKEKLENERRSESDRQAQAIATREAFLASPAGKKELELSKKILAKFLDKPLAISCSSKDDRVIVFSKKSDEIFKEARLSFEAPPQENLIKKSWLVSKDIISITNEGNVTTEYKFNDKSIQIYNSNFVVNGIYKSSNSPTPQYLACEKNTMVGQLFTDELNGSAEKRRQQVIAKAKADDERKKAELKAKRDAVPYKVLFSCFDKNGVGNDTAFARNALDMFRKFSNQNDILMNALNSLRQYCELIGQDIPAGNVNSGQLTFMYTANNKSYYLYKNGDKVTLGLIRDLID